MNSEKDLAQEVCESIERCFKELSNSVQTQEKTISKILEAISNLQKDNEEIVSRINKIQQDLYNEELTEELFPRS